MHDPSNEDKLRDNSQDQQKDEAEKKRRLIYGHYVALEYIKKKHNQRMEGKST